jgi:hypothetical protein
MRRRGERFSRAQKAISGQVYGRRLFDALPSFASLTQRWIKWTPPIVVA